MHLPQPLKISRIKNENAYTKTFTLNASLKADPGQFMMVWLPGLEDKPFSLARADPVTLTIADVGPFSHAIHQLRVGELLWARGPLGRGYRLPEGRGAGRHILLIGGGYGAAPLYFLAQRALAQGWQLSAIMGAKSEGDLLLVGDFRDMGLSLRLTSEDGSIGQRGLATDAFLPLLAELPAKVAAVYACGPQGMLKAVSALCRAENIPAQLSWEAIMRCGIALCGSCELGAGWLACLDGPVFSFDPLER